MGQTIVQKIHSSVVTQLRTFGSADLSTSSLTLGRPKISFRVIFHGKLKYADSLRWSDIHEKFELAIYILPVSWNGDSIESLWYDRVKKHYACWLKYSMEGNKKIRFFKK